MKKRILSFLLVLTMLLSIAPVSVFATDSTTSEAPVESDPNSINYVSLGDSMANGYGFVGYHQDSKDLNTYDFKTGQGMYGDGAYPLQFEQYLEKKGYAVNHTKLAASGMLAEDLLYLLGGREYFDDGWGGYKDYVGNYNDSDLMGHIQNAVTDADIITMGIGNASFGAFLMQKVTDALGVMREQPIPTGVKFENAIAVLKLDAEQYALVMQVYNMLSDKLIEAVPADLVNQYNLESIVDLMAYTTASYIVNYKLLVEKILEMNSDVEIVLVGLLNTTYGMNVTDENGNVILPFGDVMDSIFGTLNAYMAGLPAVLQAQGVAEEAKLYYASQPNPLFICQEFENLLNNEWGSTDLRMDGSTVRERNIDAFNSNLTDTIGKAIQDKPLAEISLDDIQSYDGSRWGANEQSPDIQLSVAIYLAIEEAVARNTNTMDISLTGLMKIAGDLSSVFTALGDPPTGSPEESRKWLLRGLNTDEIKGMCKIYGLFKVGNGMSVHPTPAGHDQIAASVISAYAEKHTVQDETIKNVEIVLNELYNLVETYGPEVAAQVWAQWEEYGYVDAVETTIEDLQTMLEERHTYYADTALPAITASVENLSAQKDTLTAELAELKAELEVKKTELANVVNNTQIGDIYAPNINIDVELGGNSQTLIPENDCTVDGEDIKTELEAAVKDLEHAIATIEALIADVNADIADMIDLAEQIMDAVAELEKTMESLAEAAEDVEVAVKAVIDVIENSDGVVEATLKSFKAARATANAAVEVLNLTMDTAEEMMADVDAMIETISADAEALYNKFMEELPGCIEQIPDEAKMLIGGSVLAVQQAYEANKEEINAALAAELAKLAEEYGINEESVKAELDKLTKEYEANKAAAEAELAAIEAKITEEVNAKYAKVKADFDAQIEAKKAEAADKLAELEAELQGYQAELEALAEDAAEEVRAGIQAQIDRVTADIATVNADLEHAVSHLENAAEEAYEQIVAEVTKVYEEAIAALEQKLNELKAAYDKAVAAVEQKLAELKATYDKAADDLTDAADKAIEDLTEELDKALEELDKIGEDLANQIDGILSDIRNELSNAQKAIEEILKGNLAAIEELKEALVELGGEAIVDAVDALLEAVMALIEEASTADLVIDDDFKYVAIGDGSAAAESYVEKLTAALNAEAADNEVDAIEMVNYAKAGNTVSAERANLSDVTDADLITVGFSNVGFLQKAMAGEVALDWAALIGEANVKYVDEMMADVNAELEAVTITGTEAIDNSIKAKLSYLIEATAYSAVQYTVELPALINEIHAVNPDAVVIIVGMYNPLDDVVFTLGEGATLDVGEYVDYLVDGVAVHGLAYSILTGNSIYVDARDVATVNSDKEVAFFGDIVTDIFNIDAALVAFVDTLYPSAVGDDYIAGEIADALNITYVKSEPVGLLGDADGNGVVNTNDAMYIMQYVVGARNADQIDLSVSDVDGKDGVNTNDAMYIMQYVVGSIAKFPAEK